MRKLFSKLLIFLGLSITTVFSSGCDFFDTPDVAEHSLTLNGATVLTLNVGDNYVEQGATAIYNDEDISNQIVTKYFVNTLSGEEVPTINTESIGNYFVQYSISKENWNESLTRQVTVKEKGATDSISINFLELGNANTGDCTYIKAGDVDILIDAGSKKNSAPTVVNYLKEHVLDGTIEYLIVTHAHEDHIAALVGNGANGVLSNFKIKNLIQFSITDVTSVLYQSYCELVQEQIEKNQTILSKAGTLVKENKNVIKITKDITMTILDQKYYYEHTSDENNYSVCTLFTHVNNNYLFTGDLEKAGETSLIQLNSLPKVQLFKAGHHGSPTSSNANILEVIKPEIICVCCCAGNKEYTSKVENQFPSQAFIDRVAIYTKKVYVTTVTSTNEQKHESMNGIITFTSEGNSYEIRGSNNDLMLKDTQWFKTTRTCPDAWL